ncbi:TVP38/TMEM64 family protein [Acetobacter oryzoeni]|uniref:TVP38/TMEM64 family membrane protein n=1 Tax=Acetobacter oryzoeni TaxID=2500548 RepID=A0A5B9GEM5_9PROT|nr:TVP38/TMEM64 family protein [Acetobacter oryzoeni]
MMRWAWQPLALWVKFLYRVYSQLAGCCKKMVPLGWMEQHIRPPSRSSVSLLRPLLMLLVLVVGAVGLRHVPALHTMLHGTDVLRQGVWGRMVFLSGAVLWCGFGLPRQVAGFAAGLAYGLWEGLALITIASTLGCLAGFFWARWGGRVWARQKLGQRFAQMDAFLTRQPFSSILTLRLLPVGSALLLNLLGGISGMDVLPFFTATLLGGIPQNLVAVLLGAGVQVGTFWQYAAGGALFVLSGAIGVWLWRHARIARQVS